MGKSRITTGKSSLTITPLKFFKRYLKYTYWNRYLNWFILIAGVTVFMIIEKNALTALYCFGPFVITFLFGLIIALKDKYGFAHKLVLTIESEIITIKHNKKDKSFPVSSITFKRLLQSNQTYNFEIYHKEKLCYKTVSLTKDDDNLIKKIAQRNNINDKYKVDYVGPTQS